MKRRSVLTGLALGAGAVSSRVAAAPRARTRQTTATPVLNSLAMAVSPQENRQYSYTDKVSGYFHGRTHTDENPDWFNGWNIATKRIFHDYRLSVDGVALMRARAEVVVSPHKLVRRFEGATETLSLLDGLAVLVLSLSNVIGDTIGLALRGDLTDAGTLEADGVWFAPKEAAGSYLLVAPIAGAALRLDGVSGVIAAKSAKGFYLIHAATKPEARRLLLQVSRLLPSLQRDRTARMEGLVSGDLALDAGDPDRTKALLWMRLTTDQLVMKQMGTGIYAGLPWFNDYWGRDTFISITGALFVTGQYEIAADVFRSFAALQDVDPASKTFGRVPNRARPDGIEYNSADGTPRFIITLADLVNRSGNVALARELWPAVKRAVEGVLKHNVDELGLITHDDADTWMDAKEKGVRAWSLRGNRAIDVQALWLRAFYLIRTLAPAYANMQPSRIKLLEQCSLAAKRLEEGLQTHFVVQGSGRLVDHIKPDGTKDTKLRPNILFALREIYPAQYSGDPKKYKIVKEIWEGLVYPWGVATLSQDDPDFYPYHEHWYYYHKDAAYHNGTVWPWLNGAAMDAMLDIEENDLPWQLFENMNRQALREGAIGSLAECADALPLPAATWTRRTGTFLQAWSNAEHLRIWHERFLGLSISALNSVSVMITPSLPQSVINVSASIPVGRGALRGIWHNGTSKRWRFEAVDTPISFFFNPPGFKHSTAQWSMESGQRVEIEVQSEVLVLKAYSALGRLVGQTTMQSAKVNFAENAAKNGDEPLLVPTDEIQFCKPRLNPNLKSLSVRHDPPLTY